MAEQIYKVKLTEETNYKVKREDDQTEVKILMLKGEDGESGISTYAELPDKPQINDVTLAGNQSFEDLGALSLTNIDIENIINSIV